MLNKIKLTPAQTLIAHVLISGLVSALFAGIVAAFDAVATNGFDWSNIWHIFATAFIPSFAACYLSIKSNPQLGQAEMDTLSQIHEAATTTIPQMLQSIQQPVQAAPLVVVHAAQSQAETGTPPSTEQPTAPQSNLSVSVPPQTSLFPGYGNTNAPLPPQTQLSLLPQQPTSNPQPQFIPQQPFQRNWDTGLVPTVGPNQPGQ